MTPVHTIGKAPAFPTGSGSWIWFSSDAKGVTKRELFAAMAMQGVISGTKAEAAYSDAAHDAVKYAALEREIIGECL